MDSPLSSRTYDCIVIGGGPAGLTAAIYLARYHLSVLLFDDQTSRAATIPICHNYPAFPDGVSGPELLVRIRSQAERYGACVQYDSITGLSQKGDVFHATTTTGYWPGRAVLLATGVTNRQPSMSRTMHDQAVDRGLLRYCPVCDGFEVTDQNVGVLGTGRKAFREAIFLRSFTRGVTFVASEASHGLTDEQARELHKLGIEIESGPVNSIEMERGLLVLNTSGRQLRFSSVYPALGSVVRSELASRLGAKLSPEGCVVVDSHQRTTVQGLYAAGDIVLGLDQISHAMGQAGVAATSIRNDLSEQAMLIR